MIFERVFAKIQVLKRMKRYGSSKNFVKEMKPSQGKETSRNILDIQED